MNGSGDGYTDPASDEANQDDLTAHERCFHSIFGFIRFDYEAVANALRTGTLTPVEMDGLASLLEGYRPDGLSLKIMGQGRNWMPISEAAARFRRATRIANMMDELLQSGVSWEAATIDTAEHFGVSEATVSRDARLMRPR